MDRVILQNKVMSESNPVLSLHNMPTLFSYRMAFWLGWAHLYYNITVDLTFRRKQLERLLNERTNSE